LTGTAAPAVPTLDQESPGSSPGGATESAASDSPVVALSLFSALRANSEKRKSCSGIPGKEA
jgi:hypothetical protein